MMHLSLKNNLHNLNQYWQALGVNEFNGEFIHKSWPNKQWQADFSLPLASTTSSLAANKIYSTAENTDNVVLQNLSIKSQLVAMNWQVDDNDINSIDMSIKPKGTIVSVQDVCAANHWAKACSQAFGYEIDVEVIEHLIEDENAFLFSYLINNEIAGTAIGYKSGEVLGIHQLGTVPSYRKMGVAAILMQYLLCLAKNEKYQVVSLQASQAGLHLYKKLGFKEVGTLTSLVHN